jgi:hypothetical protein
MQSFGCIRLPFVAIDTVRQGPHVADDMRGALAGQTM